MRSGNRSNALLVELMIVVMFFMLTTSVLLEVFAKARQLSDRSEYITDSLVKAQNFADRLYAAEDAETLLSEIGFTRQDNNWILTDGSVQFEAILSEEKTEAGVFRRQEIRAIADGVQLFALPCSRWEGLP